VGLGIILPGILLLGIVIFVHELGHFLVAKWRGVTVVKFSLGMGPEMLGFSYRGTRYCLSWVPLGGFVQMAGDKLDDRGEVPTGGPEQFLTHPWWGRVLIALAGPAANFVTCFVVLVLTLQIGVRQPDAENVLGPVPDTSAAFVAGLREGDVVSSFNGRPVRTWRDLAKGAGEWKPGTALEFGLQRGDSMLALPVPSERAQAVMIGLQPLPLPAVVGTATLGMPAYQAGVKKGDRVLSVGGKPVRWFHELADELQRYADRPVTLHIERAGREFDVTLTPKRYEGRAGRARVGLEPPRGMEVVERSSLAEALPAAWRGTLQLVGDNFRSIGMAISRPAYYGDAMGGPIFIGQLAQQSAERGLDQWLYMLAFINIAVMAFNLLPVPVLDGGHIVLAFLEALRRRPITGRIYAMLMNVGAVLLLSLFLIVISKDILRPFQRMQAVDRASQGSPPVAPRTP
jgi:regulator of sigma E protease